MVAERASCSVAIVRSPRESEPAVGHTKWVMVPVSIFTDNDIIDAAVDQARLLQRPLAAVGVWQPDLGATPYDALDSLVAQWQERYPDVHIYPVSIDTGMTQFLHGHPEMAGLIVIDADASGDVKSTSAGNTIRATEYRACHARRPQLRRLAGHPLAISALLRDAS